MRLQNLPQIIQPQDNMVPINGMIKYVKFVSFILVKQIVLVMVKLRKSTDTETDTREIHLTCWDHVS